MKQINILAPSLFLILASCGETAKPSVGPSNPVAASPTGADDNSGTSSNVTLGNDDVLGTNQPATVELDKTNDIILEKKKGAPASSLFLAQVSCSESMTLEHKGKAVYPYPSTFKKTYISCESSNKDFNLLAKKLNGVLYNAESQLAQQGPILSFVIAKLSTTSIKTKKAFYNINAPQTQTRQNFDGIYTTMRLYDDFNQRVFDCPIKKLADEDAAKKCVEVK